MITCLMSRPNLKKIKILQNTSLQWKRLKIKEAHQLGDKTEPNVSKWPINDKKFYWSLHIFLDHTSTVASQLTPL